MFITATEGIPEQLLATDPSHGNLLRVIPMAMFWVEKAVCVAGFLATGFWCYTLRKART